MSRPCSGRPKGVTDIGPEVSAIEDPGSVDLVSLVWGTGTSGIAR